MKIIILTEGGKSLGFGHIVRMKSLYEGFKEIGFEAFMIVNGDENVEEILKDVRYKLLNWVEDMDILSGILKNTDIAVVDSYLANYEVYKFISERVKLPVYLDDFNRLNYPKGVVINPNPFAKDLTYPKNGNVYLLGTKYAILRKEFWNVPEKEIRKEIQEVMITFGGTDVRNMTVPVLKHLIRHFPDIKKHVVIGAGFRDMSSLIKAKDTNTHVYFNLNAKELLDIMLRVDVAITAGGYTTHELARVGVPMIIKKVAENQEWNVRFFKAVGAPELELSKLKDILNSLNFERRKELSKKLRKLYDGKSTIRLCETLIKLCGYGT